LLLGIAIAVSLESVSRETRDHILLSQIRAYRFRRRATVEEFDSASTRDELNSYSRILYPLGTENAQKTHVTGSLSTVVV
jgi:hypothetical protein